MAKVTTLDPPAETAPEERKNGPPKGKQAESETPKFHLDPRLPKNLGDANAGTNEEYLASIQQEHWKHLTCYVYRAGPVTDRQSAGKETSIDKIGAPFDYPEILKRHGSGRYKFILSYAPPNGGQWIRVRQWYETILNLDFPPRVPLGEWLDNPANKDWEWARPMLIEEDQKRAAAVSERLNTGQGDSVAQAIEIIEKVRGKNDDNPTMAVALIQMLNSQAERTAAASDPAKQLEMAKSLKELAAPAVPAQDNSVMLLLIQLIKEQGETHRAELAAMREQSKPAEDSLGKKVMEAMITKFLTGEGFGGGGAEPKADLGSTIAAGVSDVLGKVVEKGTEVLPGVLATIQHIKDRDLQIAQTNAARQMNPERPWEFQGRTQPPQQVTAPPQTAAPQTQAPPPSQPPSQPTTPMPQPLPQPIQAFLAKYQGALTKHFSSIMHTFQNTDGYEMLDVFLNREGRDFVDTFQKDASVDLLWQMTQLNTNLKAIFQPEDKARQYFTELMTKPEDIPDEDEDQEEDKDVPVGRMGNA